MNHQKNQPIINKNCFFCANNVNAVDYKDTLLLRRFMNTHAKIISPRRTGNCARHQRMITRAIKRARTMALLSYTIK